MKRGATHGQEFGSMDHPLLAPRRTPWTLIGTLVVLAAFAGAWTAGWHYAADRVESRIDEWRAREARAGRIQTCGRQAINGFPFRIVVRCTNAAFEVRHQQPPLAVKAKEVVVVAQIYDPSHLVAEFVGPLTISEPTRVLLTANWGRNQLQVWGTGAKFERMSIVLDDVKFEQPGPTLVMSASRLELNSRIASGRAFENPVLDLSGHTSGALVPGLGPIGEKPGEAEFTAVLHGLKSLMPKPTPVVLRELQAAGGRLEVTNVRVQQGESIAVGAGTLSLSASGRPDGQLRLTVTGVERLVHLLGLDRAFGQMVAQRGGALGIDRGGGVQNALDRIMPGLGNVARSKAAQAGLQMGLALLGEPAELEGRRALTMPLRFSDGQTMLGPLRLGQVPPLY